MPNLQETAKFIKENKHLAGGVSKTTDMEENGLSLGEMNRVLMQKVEELTLYLIDKDKRIEALEKRLNQILKKDNGSFCDFSEYKLTAIYL